MEERKRWRINAIRPVRVFDGQDQGVATALKAAYESLPTMPVTPNVAAWSASPNDDSVDRISSSLDEILWNVDVSRLPAAKNAVTATGGLWRSAPLVFSDVHLVPECKDHPLWRPSLVASYDVWNAVSAVLAEHPGPFRCLHITCCYMDMVRETAGRQHVKRLVIHEFQGKRNEHAFIRFVGETVQVLEKVVIMLSSNLAPWKFRKEARRSLTAVKWANENLKIYFKLPSNHTPFEFPHGSRWFMQGPF